LTLADVLAKVLEKKVEDGYFGLSHAHEMIDKILRSNAKELFKL
jgi:predicted TIM-barrel fold metal-dependent hydrolase